ncbi:MAG TPA: metallophosphoesterase [Desulfobulbaceae bacterium]|nr:metallophosphoesterase [Desulfobulbaceae bacterium]
MKILLLSDIHGNFPALTAVAETLNVNKFDVIINAGDSIVYAPFANQVLDWLRAHKALSILGNTDIKVKKLLKGKTFKKPSKPEKRIMYTSTADTLNRANARYLFHLKKKKILRVGGRTIGIFHGSPEHTNEFLFDSTPDIRFQELTDRTDCDIVITGHSHTPYHKKIAGVHFINPGSTGRMFDGDPRASCAILTLKKGAIGVKHYRIPYAVEKVVDKLAHLQLPTIYATMYRSGRKLN